MFEISSDSTANYDRTEKFASYRQIPSLREYLLLSQHKVLCEHFVRQDDDTWAEQTYASPTDTLTLTSAGIALPLRDVYAHLAIYADDSDDDANDE